MSFFLSHSSNDKDIARKIAHDLQAQSVDVWFDEWAIKVGDSITQKIQQGLGNSRYVGVLLSEKSVTSGWVEKEWQSKIGIEARTNQTVILPILIEQCEIPILLQDKKYVDISKDYHNAINEIVGVIKSRPNLSLGNTIKKQQKKLTKKLAFLISGSVLSLGIAYPGWSAYCVFSFLSAAQSVDISYLKEHVDWASVRAFLSNDAERLAQSVGFKAMDSKKNEHKIAGILTFLAGPYLANRAIDYWISPEGISSLANKENFVKDNNSNESNPNFQKSSQNVLSRFSFSVTGFNEIQVHSKENDLSKRISFVFRAEGFTWKLIRVILPSEILNVKDIKFEN